MKNLVFLWDDTIENNFGFKEKPELVFENQPECNDLVIVMRLLSQQNRLVILDKPHHSKKTIIEPILVQSGLSHYFGEVVNVPLANSGNQQMVDFRSVAERLSCPPADLGLVSGSYSEGVIAANLAGCKTVWINPSGAIAPGHLPIHNVEVAQIKALPEALFAQGSLPDIQTCQGWYQREIFSAPLWMHVQMVAVVAYQLAVWLRAAGEIVDPLLTHRGALLHDLGKLSARQSAQEGESISHGELAARRLECYGQPVLAEIARRHMLFCVLENESNPQTWEQVLVYYADKLVEGAEITGYQVRLAALQARYAGIEGRLGQTTTHIEAMQSNICRIIGFNCSDLVAQLRDAVWGQ